MDYQAFRLPRRGNELSDCEDAYAVDAARGRFAVADGAAGSVFAQAWAQLLVAGFVGAREVDHWADWLPAVQQQFACQVGGQPLPWYAEEKLQAGAAATFLGVVLYPESRQWLVSAVGDSCLFHLRQERLLQALPLTQANQFGNRPRLLGSRQSAAELGPSYAAAGYGTGQPDDWLWLMTDALAHWCLARHELGGNPWAELAAQLGRSATGDEPFAAWIGGLRDKQGLRNDDVALVAIHL